jgi:hypothetical protein
MEQKEFKEWMIQNEMELRVLQPGEQSYISTMQLHEV